MTGGVSQSLFFGQCLYGQSDGYIDDNSNQGAGTHSGKILKGNVRLKSPKIVCRNAGDRGEHDPGGNVAGAGNLSHRLSALRTYSAHVTGEVVAAGSTVTERVRGPQPLIG